MGINTASYTNDDTLTLNGRYTLSSVEMGNRRYQSDTKSELLLQFEEVSAVNQYNPIGSVLITGDALEGSVLTGDGSAVTDGDGIVSSSITYQWLRDGLEISGATSSDYTLTQADIGKSVAVKYSFRDQSTALEEVVSAGSALVANVSHPVSGTVAITGTAAEDQTLTADTSALADDDGLGSFSYQWLRDGTEISGATGSTHDLKQADVCLLYTSPSPRDRTRSRMPSSA